MTHTILVVDDQSSVRQLLQEYLSEQGFRVLTATDGQNAIYAARHDPPDLILLDIMMPKIDGYQFLRQYRQERQTPQLNTQEARYLQRINQALTFATLGAWWRRA